jgi:hypothetical protein
MMPFGHRVLGLEAAGLTSIASFALARMRANTGGVALGE